MKRNKLFAKLFFAVALVGAMASMPPASAAGFGDYCVFKCRYWKQGPNCPTVQCKCDALGGQWTTCSACSDSDYGCT